MKERIAVVPKIGDYDDALRMLVERCLGCKSIPCPPITKRTVEVGAKHSPDTVCTPFKIVMGNFIEALEKGANVLFMPGFGCRLGFYDMLHEQILRELGYEFEMVALCDYTATATRIFNSLTDVEPTLTRQKFDEIFAEVCKMIYDIDMKRRAEYKLENPTLRIGIAGDLYTVMEPHGNHDMEKWLLEHNIEVVRLTDLTYLATNLFDVNKLIGESGGYVDYNLGGNANSTIAQVYKMVSGENPVDGVIHIKAATCTPEISAMTILQDMSADFEVPFMYMTFDTETGEAGLHTRLEAFCDMLTMKRAKRN